MRTFYTVEDTVNYDPIFEADTLEECVDYLKNSSYTAGEARICKYFDDGDPECVGIITGWE